MLLTELVPLSSYFCPSGRNLPNGLGPAGSNDKFNYLYLPISGKVAIKESPNLRINGLLIFAPAFGLSKFRFFSSVNTGGASKEDISLSCVSKLGLKLYENPVTHKSRELIRKDNKGKIGVYC